MNITILLPTLLIGVALAGVIYTLLSRIDEREVVRDSLRQLDGYELENQRDAELLAPFAERALVPVLEGLTGLGRRFTPMGYVDKVRQKFVYAGDATPDAVDRFLAVRVVTAVGAVLAFFAVFVFGLLPLSPGMATNATGGFLILALLLGPDSILNRKVQERQHGIQVMLPDVLDLLTISVEAGLGFEQAMDRVIDSVPGPLSDEFARMLGETRAGASRADAMRSMDERCNVAELRSFVLAILQADTFGVSIGRVLRAQSEEMRIKRRQLAQEKAQKAPVKMLIPMVFCIFPALFVVVLGPAALNIRDSFGG
ncbi:MAG: type II secretion system F family protein [Microthrixaceae bacterium]|nr:type II secretion system F family protein [Microthrixaceae bacterium]